MTSICGAILLLLAGTTCCSALMLREISVDPQGHGAFRTLSQARDHARTIRSVTDGPIRIKVGPGVYPTLVLTEADAGTSRSPIEYVATSFLDSTAPPSVITGGRVVPNEAFTAVGGSSPLVRADLFSHGFSKEDLGTMMNGGSIGDCQHAKTDLIFQGKRMVIGRWPNIAQEQSPNPNPTQK